MICDKCKKRQATVHRKIMINGIYAERHLCSECARDYDSELDLLTPASILSSMFTTVEGPTAKRCKTCGTTATEFKRTGRVGCADCYNALSDSVLPMIKRVQGSVSHVGSAPTPTVKPKTELETLKMELSEAVRAEDYKKAAILRDKIKEIEGGQNNG